MLASQATDQTNYQRRWGLQYNSSICNFGEIVFADIKPITVDKLTFRNNEQKVEAIRLGKTTNGGEHIVATKVFYTRSVTRMKTEQPWNKKIFDAIDIPQLDTTMNADYTEEDDIGKAIIEQFFTKTRLTTKQPSHRLMVNNKEIQQPPDLDKQEQQQDEYITTIGAETIQPPPGLDIAQHTYVQPTASNGKTRQFQTNSQVDKQTTSTNCCTTG
eukprot:6491675-Amphidinium_carterae.2